ncbi:tetratricopeptide repeat protein [Mucilaginibacter segetis]|uniref:Tetratricopeptide repeat protein n=1 Tax=Mucilaginibacter segetis TaxID=2793071 RepID=A0A934ULT2_9SPHI|nr:hypothetical protein [Mucilaginibacter segetis]MBK0378157.1 hypothetical protein [Mucilaginibacter segetis]
MKPKLLILITLFLSVRSFAQDFRSEFKTLINKDDTEATLTILNKWQKAKPDDPELYVAFYNFYAKEGLKEALSMTTTETEGKSVTIKDKDGKIVGYLGGSGSHNETYLQKGFNYIDTAIAKFPDRLDMRFGKVYVLGRIGDYANFTKEIIKTVNYGESTGLKWTWTDNKPLDDPKGFMLSTIQNYVVQLFNAGDQNMEYIKAIAATVLNYYPDNVESLSNLAISYISEKNYNKALDPLLKAEKINPQDYIVLNNIAYCYSLQGDKPNAIKYYELTIKYGDEKAKNQANEKLAELRSNLNP